jgi:colicin import membrane protein
MAAALPPNTGIKLSATARSVLKRRREPGGLPAALFAIIVHAAFFALIIFGVSWQVKPPQTLNAEIWRALPDINAPKLAPVAEVAPEPPPLPPAPVVEKAPPQQSRADIEMKDKQARLDKQKADERRREEEKRAQDKRDKEKREQEKRETEKMQRAIEAERTRARAEADAREAVRQEALRAARDRAIADYASKIRALIASRANIPDSVTGKPVIEVRLRLLVNGAVLDAQVVRASGNRAYDDAVERAINAIRQWPLPDDPALLGGRRELILRIEHER